MNIFEEAISDLKKLNPLFNLREQQIENSHNLLIKHFLGQKEKVLREVLKQVFGDSPKAEEGKRLRLLRSNRQRAVENWELVQVNISDFDEYENYINAGVLITINDFQLNNLQIDFKPISDEILKAWEDYLREIEPPDTPRWTLKMKV